MIISYLVPSYNHAKYLPCLLDNIVLDINTLNFPAEIIIVDDGSKDESSLIIKEWEKKNTKIKTITVYQENQGIPSVLNKLISLASGKYLRLCASDDIVIPGSTNVLYDEFSKDDNLICIVGDAMIIDGSNKIIHDSSIRYHGGRIDKLLDKNQLIKELISHWCIAGPSLLIKKEHYSSFLYEAGTKIDDFDLYLSLLEKNNSLRIIKNIVCKYRIHGENISKTKNITQRIDNIKSFEFIIKKYITNTQLRPFLLPLYNKTKAKIFFLEKSYVKSFIYVLRSLFYQLKQDN